MAESKATIKSVREGSVAQRIGLRPGDTLISLNGAPVRDQIDYRFQAAEDRIEIVAARGAEVLTFLVDREPGEEFGLDFAEATFDGLRRCRNRCLFCFVDRLPRGLRPSLYVKDDDYRYSFLFGSYVTLTNLVEEDWARITAQRLSPLYVSVHASDLALRRRLLGNPNAPDILAQLRRLAEARIDVHAQIVLCPGLNDGAELERTIADLAELATCVQSVAVVPVGLTRHGAVESLRRFDPAEMGSVVRRVSAWQRQLRRKLGRGFVHLADEFYLRSGCAIPSARSYDGYPQYENGVGMARVLLSEWLQVRRRLQRGVGMGATLTVACGELSGPLLRPIVEEISATSGADVRLRPIQNRFFGPTVTVSGLLTAADVIAQLGDQPLGDVLVLPLTMFDDEGARTLDEASVATIEDALGVPVVLAVSIKELVRWVANPVLRAAS